MPTFKFTAPDGKQYSVNGPDGASEQQAFQILQTQLGAPAAEPVPPPAKPFGEQLNDTISDLPRQVGLTARAGLQGIGGMADLIASPVRGALNMLPGVNIKPGVGQALANGLSLPKPRPGLESTVSSGAEMLAGGVLPIGAGAALARGGTGVAQSVGKLLAARPAQQLASAGAAGLAGGHARETGGDEKSQFAASLAAGLATPFALSKTQQAAGAASRMARGATTHTPAQLDITISSAMQPAAGQSGMAFGDLSAGIQAGIRKDVADAYRLTGTVTPAAIRRLADYRLTGTTPTAATLTLDPATISQQKNLAKLGVNSKDVAAQALGQTENANNRLLIENINALGAGTAGAPVAGGRRIISALEGRDQRASKLIGGAYEAARSSNGRSALLNHEVFVDRANTLLDDALLGGKLPPDVRNVLAKDWQKVVKKPRAPGADAPPEEFGGLPVDVAEQIKTQIAALQRASSDGAERKALSLVRQSLDETPLLPNQEIGQEAIKAFDKARGLNRSWMQIVERTPALQAVRDGIEPDKFVQQFIIGSGGKANVADVNALHGSIKSNPDAIRAVKEQIVGHLKARALNGAADEVGNISQSAYNKALKDIGDEKLAKFFGKSEVDQLKAIGRVASYEQVQPRGAAVNNSNTASAALSSVFDRIASSPLLSKIPFGSALSQPVQNIAVGINSSRALNVPNSLAAPRLAPPRRNGLLVSPALLMGGEDEKRPRGLLSP